MSKRFKIILYGAILAGAIIVKYMNYVPSSLVSKEKSSKTDTIYNYPSLDEINKRAAERRRRNNRQNRRRQRLQEIKDLYLSDSDD